MREKELRLALICYGGVSLAVYMHGVTKEIWHLAQASRAHLDGEPFPPSSSSAIYQQMLTDAQSRFDLKLRVVPDIVSGASAGGINGVFLAHALESGQSLDPLTELWMKSADADTLLDPDARPLSRFTKLWAAPLLWLLMRRRGDTVERTVAPETREEVRRKLSNLVRARWFAPPFGGEGFSGLLLDAFDAMAAAPAGKPLLPDGHPLDLFVTVTDFGGHEEALALNSPPEVIETEHRLTIGFKARGFRPRMLAETADLTFAARATASFPGAFPPFTARELDRVLERRGQTWPSRERFLARILSRRHASREAQDAVLIDGSVLANAPFAQAIAALKDRPARRPVDRRFVYIEPTPSSRGFRLTSPVPAEPGEAAPLPGFFRTIFGAVSDIPREQPIRDNLETIAERSRRIRRMQHIVDALRPDIEQTVERTVGRTLFLIRPTARRLAGWRTRLHSKAVKAAGFAYPSYAHLKLSGVVETLAATISDLSGHTTLAQREAQRQIIWSEVRARRIDQVTSSGRDAAAPDLITFFRQHDIEFRIRRLRFLTRLMVDAGQQEAPEENSTAANEARSAMRDMLYSAITRYADRQTPAWIVAAVPDLPIASLRDAATALETIASTRSLDELDEETDAALADALMALPAEERRSLLRGYLGYPYYDIATLPLLQGEGLDEYDPIRVDRISPDDARAIRSGGAAATLRGIEFNCFGAFFSRAYRENDYLWGRLHGADRLIDILLSTLPEETTGAADYKRRIFRAILDEEEPRLKRISTLIADLREEVDAIRPAS